MYLNVFMGSEINDYVYRNSLGSTFPGHFLPTDPNVGENSYGWSTTASGADRKFGNFDEIAPPVPSNWEIHIPWSAPGNEDVRLFVFTDFFFSIVCKVPATFMFSFLTNSPFFCIFVVVS